MEIYKKNCDFAQNDPDFGQNFRKIPIFVKIFEILDFGRNFWIFSIVMKILADLDFGKKSQILDFG